MARGEKLDLSFDDFDDGWKMVDANEHTLNTPPKACEPKEHRLSIRYEKRRGKPVTMAGEFFMPDAVVKDILKKLKKSLGSGGTYKNGWIEIQGDKKEPIKDLLKTKGFRFKS